MPKKCIHGRSITFCVECTYGPMKEDVELEEGPMDVADFMTRRDRRDQNES